LKKESKDNKAGTNEQLAKPVTKSRAVPDSLPESETKSEPCVLRPLPTWADLGFGFGKPFCVEYFSRCRRNVQLHHHHPLRMRLIAARIAGFDLGQSVWDLWWAKWQGFSPSFQFSPSVALKPMLYTRSLTYHQRHKIINLQCHSVSPQSSSKSPVLSRSNNQPFLQFSVPSLPMPVLNKLHQFNLPHSPVTQDMQCNCIVFSFSSTNTVISKRTGSSNFLSVKTSCLFE